MTVEVDKASRNARRLYAAVSIDAPLSQVWGALTDYEGLGNFIPGIISDIITSFPVARRVIAVSGTE